MSECIRIAALTQEVERLRADIRELELKYSRLAAAVAPIGEDIEDLVSGPMFLLAGIIIALEKHGPITRDEVIPTLDGFLASYFPDPKAHAAVLGEFLIKLLKSDALGPSHRGVGMRPRSRT